MSKPNFITITGQSASGKSYLLDKLIELGLCKKVISYTTRQPREGEKEGIDYYFISDDQFNRMAMNGEFVEKVSFSGGQYGTTLAEIKTKMSGGVPAVIIVDPQGMTQYKQIGRKKGWKMKHIFVHIPDAVREHRMQTRLLSNLQGLSQFEQMKVLQTFLKRYNLSQDEQEWIVSNDWDLIVPGNILDYSINAFKYIIEQED